MSWQLIESAPRDGTLIQARDGEGNIFFCRWYTRGVIAEFFDDPDPSGYEPGWYKGDDSEEEEWPTMWKSVDDAQA